MKPGPFLFAAAGAGAALLIAWLALGTDSEVSTATTSTSNAAETTVLTLEPDADLDAVEARASGEREASEIDESRLAPGQRAAKGAPAKTEREAATGPYTGRLLDPLGRPMGGVELTIVSWEEAARDALGGMNFTMGRKRTDPTGTTAEDGKFTVVSKESLGRSLGVTAKVPGYSDGAIQCILDPEKGRDLGDVLLRPAVRVTGWVRDASGRAVAGARVRRIPRNGDGAADLMDQIGFGGLVEAATTDLDGRFELLHEDPGMIRLSVESDDILPLLWDGPTKLGGEVLLDVVLRVDRAGRIDGQVVGYPVGRRRGMVAAVALDDVDKAEAGSGVSELLAAQLSPAGDYTGKIREDGSFTLPGLTPGARYRVRAIAKQMFVNTVELSDPVDARAGDGLVTLQFDPGTTVVFQAVDARTGKPVEELTVSGRYATESAFLQLSETAGDPPDRFPGGKVVLYELRPKKAPQRLTLTVNAPGYFRTSDVELDVPSSGTVNLGKVALTPAPTLRFRVVDAATSKPVRRARVTVEPTDAASLDFSGRRGRGRDSGDVEEETVETDEEREDREAAEAMLFGGYRVRSRGRTDREGRVALAMVDGRRVSLEITARGYATHVEEPFAAPPDDEKEIVVRLFSGGLLQVFVSDDAGDPAAGVKVECRREVGGRTVKKAEKTDEVGLASFEHLAVGTWEVRAFRTDNSIFAEGGRGSAAHDTEWIEAEVPRGVLAQIELVVPAVGDLSGVVLLGDEPAQDARVSLTEPDRVEQAERMLEFQDRFAGVNTDTTTGVTDYEGRFTLTDVIPGEYILLTRHPDMAMIVRTDVEVAAGENSLDVVIPATALEGRVLDDEGKPVADAAVSVELHADRDTASERSMARQFLQAKDDARAVTDENGYYRVLGVRAGVDLDVLVEANGFADGRKGPFQANEDETRTVPPIEIERAGSLLVSSGGEALGGTLTFARARPIGGRATELNAVDKIGILRGGRARITGLLAGRWEVTVQTASGEGELSTLGPEVVEIQPGETTELEL